MKQRYLSSLLILVNVIMLAGLGFMWERRNSDRSRHEDESTALRDSLYTFKTLAEGNMYLLKGDSVSTMKAVQQIDTTSELGRQWAMLVIEEIKKRSAIKRAYGFLKDRENSLSGSVQQYRDSVFALYAGREAAKGEADMLMNQVDELTTELALTNAINRELSDQLKKARAAYGQLSFVNSQGKNIRYFGAIENGKANGFGVAIVDEKAIYEGYWSDNERHGKGRYKWANGDTYDGDFLRDKKEGVGVYTFASGERYEGGWKNDLREGRGVIMTKEGKVMAEGTWKNDKFVRNSSSTDES